MQRKVTIEDKFYSIGEVCALLETDEHVLRYWETQFKQVQPQRQKGLRRLYSKEDVMILKFIKELLHHQQYSIKGAQKIVNQYKRQDFKSGIPLNEASEPSITPSLMLTIIESIDSAIEHINHVLEDAKKNPEK